MHRQKKKWKNRLWNMKNRNSFQQMESILYGPNPQQNKTALQNLIVVLDESAAGLMAALFRI